MHLNFLSYFPPVLSFILRKHAFNLLFRTLDVISFLPPLFRGGVMPKQCLRNVGNPRNTQSGFVDPRVQLLGLRMMYGLGWAMTRVIGVLPTGGQTSLKCWSLTSEHHQTCWEITSPSLQTFQTLVSSTPHFQ